MRRFLLTWYGITDLRAAIGLEELGGPVLGALRAGDYTDVLVLAYTDPNKESPDNKQSRKKVIATLPTDPMAVTKLSRAEEMPIIDAFANTSEGHSLYKSWLREELKKLGKTVKVQMCVKELSCLNDAKGIYAAATSALDLVCAEKGEKQVTFYLSPGTPVMAFTWAFVSIVNPEFNIRIIAAPDFRKPPEEIQLPIELLAPSSRKLKQSNDPARQDFDVIFHLFGEQRLPSVLGVSQFRCHHHVFVTSPKYSAECMTAHVPRDSSFSQMEVDPFDPMGTKVAILKRISELPEKSRIGFNLTGGTKLMYSGALAACKKVSGVPFYLETRDHNIIFLDDFSVMELRGVDNLETFLQVNGFDIARSGKWEESLVFEQRRKLTKLLWRRRAQIAKAYRQLSEYTDFMDDQFIPFQIQQRDLVLSLDSNGQANCIIGKDVFGFKTCPDFAKYLCGGWLEEYVYVSLEPLLQQGVIRDMRVGLEICWRPQNGKRDLLSAQEFDVILTNGKRLLIVECKAGRVFNEDFYRLQNSVRNYGGGEGRGLLVSSFVPQSPVRKRFEAALNLDFLSEDDVDRELKNAIKAIMSTR